jgi:phospholipid/cholesterol/gamma-HCH transport system substrate-binding protein
METNINYTVVGAFVILLIASIVLSIIWLSAGFSVDQYSTYQVFMKEAVNGLATDAAVEFNGVNVGTVRSIEISHNDPQVVILLLSVKSNTPVTMGTHATLNMKGLTGIGYLALIDKGTDIRPLKALPGQPYPVIGTSPSLLVRFDTAMTRLNDSLHQVSVSIQSLLDQQNLRSIKQILVNMQSSTQYMPQLIQESRNAMNAFALQTLPAANQTMSNLSIITRNLVSVSNELKQNPAILVRGVQPGKLGPGEK